MTREEKKQAKLEKKELRRERREKNPSRIRSSFTEMSGGVQSVREIYREVNKQVKDGYMYDEDENDDPKRVPHMRHAKGMFKIRTKPTTMDVMGFMFDHELRTPAGLFGIVVDISVVLLFIVSLFTGNGNSVLLLFGVMVLTLMVVGPLSHLVQAANISKNACSENGSALYTFSATGFDIQYQSGEYTRFTWDELYRAQESKRAFYIYLEEGDGFLIPKADIAAAGRKSEQFEELLEEKSGNRFKKYYLNINKPQKV